MKVFFLTYKNHILILLGLAITLGALSVFDAQLLIGLSKIKDANSDELKEIIGTSVILLIAKNILGVLITFLISKKAFLLFRNISERRFRELLDHEKYYDNKEAVNYITNESLQAVLTVVLPLLAMITSLISISIILSVMVFSIGIDFIMILAIFTMIFVLYFVPVNAVLKKNGVLRRRSDSERISFVASAIDSKNEMTFSTYSDQLFDKYFVTPTKLSSEAISLKWLNAEVQKYIIELTGLLSVVLWGAIFYRSNLGEMIIILAPMLYAFFRLAPLANRILIAYQSVSFGAPALQPMRITLGNLPHRPIQFTDNIITVGQDPQFQINMAKPGMIILRGRSGIGKSTLLREICSTIKTSHPDRAVAFIDQVPLILPNTFSKNINVLELDFEKDIIRQLNLLAVAKTRDKEILSRNSVSAGEAARIALARAIISNTEILFVDEPLSTLDAVSAEMVFDLLINIAQKIPVICVSHSNHKPTNGIKIIELT
ncbi:MAG: ATP-binding cassette domain-containing protein [Rhodobacteraceae bacterium]|nr:ATP-binding cassette domain-containing protein [Paracoccaceae bacterium]